MKLCPKCQCETERTKRGRCKPCAHAATAAWRAANPEKLAAYYAANSEKQKATAAAWNAANPERVKASKAAWHVANADKCKARAAAYRAANPEKNKARHAAWQAANPEACRIKEQNRRARKREAGGNLSPGLAAKLIKLQRGKCACGCKQPLGDNYHLDHIMPLFLGGMNTDDNIQLLRATCNLSKHAKHPVEFMQSRGFLL